MGGERAKVEADGLAIVQLAVVGPTLSTNAVLLVTPVNVAVVLPSRMWTISPMMGFHTLGAAAPPAPLGARRGFSGKRLPSLRTHASFAASPCRCAKQLPAFASASAMSFRMVSLLLWFASLPCECTCVNRRCVKRGASARMACLKRRATSPGCFVRLYPPYMPGNAFRHNSESVYTSKRVMPWRTASSMACRMAAHSHVLFVINLPA